MDSALRAVTERFPDAGKRVAELFETDESFRDLCEDYQVCAATVARLEPSASLEQVRKEYAGLLLRLERELLRYLEEHPSS